MAEEKIKYLVRIANTDVDGNKQLIYALKKVKGVSIMYANAACRAAGIDGTKKAGILSDSEVKQINEVIKNPLQHNLPTWLLNRRKDPETGQDKHILTGDLQFTVENDIKFMKKIKTYRGTRHMFGLPCRGQKTRSNFRPNKGKVTGVKKSKAGKKAGK